MKKIETEKREKLTKEIMEIPHNFHDLYEMVKYDEF